MRITEATFSTEPKNSPKMGQGIGRIVDLDQDDGLGQLVEWAATVLPGQRLLMTADSHKQIKKRHTCLSGMAKEYGLKLRWRFAREVKVTEVYVHPEWIQSTSTEYQAWVLVTARATSLSESEKRHALLDMVLGQLDKHERENPTLDELPEWVAEPFEYDDKRTPVAVIEGWQAQREHWTAREYERPVESLFEEVG